MKITLTALNTYPIKSLQGIALETAEVQSRGLQYDRRWMITDLTGGFISQRKFPKMTLINLKITEQGLSLEAPGMQALAVNFGEHSSKFLEVKVWSDQCQALEVSTQASQWLSEFLGQNCRLVYMPDNSKRLVDPRYSIDQNITGFSDGYPFLLISEASLADLNSRLEQPVPMNRFRPNLVVSGTEAFAEDTWKKIKIGNLVFHLVKPCARCVMTTINQEDGTKGTEPLRTLGQYRKVENKILFGQNLLQETNGTLQVGDTIEVLEMKAPIEA